MENYTYFSKLSSSQTDHTPDNKVCLLPIPIVVLLLIIRIYVRTYHCVHRLCQIQCILTKKVLFLSYSYCFRRKTFPIGLSGYWLGSSDSANRGLGACYSFTLWHCNVSTNQLCVEGILFYQCSRMNIIMCRINKFS